MSSAMKYAISLGIAAAIALPAQADESRRVTVIGVHDKQATVPIAAALGVNPTAPAGGRFAMVQLRPGHGDGSYALVYVPHGISVRANDVVEVSGADRDLWRHPGKGVVARPARELASAR